MVNKCLARCLSKCLKVNCCAHQHRSLLRVESGVHVLELAPEFLPKHELVLCMTRVRESLI